MCSIVSWFTNLEQLTGALEATTGRGDMQDTNWGVRASMMLDRASMLVAFVQTELPWMV